MSQTILSIKALDKTYPNGVRALKNINLEVKAGEFLAVIGLSGSGKSTLLRCLNPLLEPTGGQVWLREENVTQVRGDEVRHLRRRMAMIFQHFNLVDRHTVISNVLMGSLARTSTLKSILGMWTPQEVQQAQSYLDLVGIGDKSHIRCDNLSGGQKQRVAIARALMQKPEILLADEPVASLDPATCHVVLDYLRKVNLELGITIICNLHFLSLVREYATRVVALKAGELVYEGSPENIDDAWFKKIYGEGAKEVHVS